MGEKFNISNLNLYYGDFHALKDVDLSINEKEITAFIGPSGCGKSTFLKCLNRMNDLVQGCKITGQVLLDGEDIYSGMDVNLLRKRVGMVFQKPNPFPMSIYDNIAYGPRTHGIRSKAKLDEIVEKSLRDAAIWDEVKDRLKKSALGMSGGQQQRLCIARALAVDPEVILMDEPTSALDPISTSKIEDLAVELKKKYTIIMVTHNMQQAVRVSDKTVFFLLGEVIESGDTEKLFSVPTDRSLTSTVSLNYMSKAKTTATKMTKTAFCRTLKPAKASPRAKSAPNSISPRRRRVSPKPAWSKNLKNSASAVLQPMLRLSPFCRTVNMYGLKSCVSFRKTADASLPFFLKTSSKNMLNTTSPPSWKNISTISLTAKWNGKNCSAVSGPSSSKT